MSKVLVFGRRRHAYKRFCCGSALVLWGALILYTPLHILRITTDLHCSQQQRLHTKPTTIVLHHYEPKISNIREMSEDEIIKEGQRRLPSLPLAYWHRHKDDINKFHVKPNCAPFPSILDLEYHNTYWQTLRTNNGTFHLYSAYLDRRNTSRHGPAVRILAVHDRLEPTLHMHCQLWFEERDAPVVVPKYGFKYMWNKKFGNYKEHELQPYMVTCFLPHQVRHLVPSSVSLVESACDRATNHLRVHYDHPPKPKDFAVCVKGLDFFHEDRSVRLVEWIELVRLLGADKIFFYELHAHPNMTKVLEYYKARDAVTVTPITLPGGQPNLPGLQHLYLKAKITHKRQMEVIPYNDCLYRHMYSYRWLVLLDIDEVIVPLVASDWVGMMRTALAATKAKSGRPSCSSYYASNVYFLDSLTQPHGWEGVVPRYMHMLHHVYRTKNFSIPGQHVKAFHETNRVLVLHNHYPFACIGGPCSAYSMPQKSARLQHYRADCKKGKSCNELKAVSVRDTALWRWRMPLITRVQQTLRALAFLPPQ